MSNEIFDRLVQFGNETDRPLFSQRLQTIWQEQGISCQSYPTITNQILDLYKLHNLVQEKQGYLEITTNRGWKEISTVLGFGDSGSAAYSVKRNYVRLGLLAYECRYDRVGLDPNAVIELSEMPHAVKKRKRTHQSISTSRNVLKTTKVSTDEKQNSPINPMNFSSNRLLPEQMPLADLSQLSFIIRAGRPAESNRSLDTLLVWLNDSRTANYFNLKSYPHLFSVVLEQYLVCLYELYGSSLISNDEENDSYLQWFLQCPLRVDPNALGPSSDSNRLERFFFGVHQHSKDFPSPIDDVNHFIINRCSCLTTILRNFSFIEENHHLANDRRLLDILQRILSLFDEKFHEDYDCFPTDFVRVFTQPSTEMTGEDPLCCRWHCQQRHWFYLLENTFITLVNLSNSIELNLCSSTSIRSRLIKSIIHWISCSLSLANQPLISMIIDDPSITKTEIFFSPSQVALQIFAKICTNEINVDWILVDQSMENLQIFAERLLVILEHPTNENDSEYCLLIICSLCKRSESLVKFFTSQRVCLEFIFHYLELYEYHQQQFLIVTLTSCCYANTNTSLPMPINHSNDMMIETCLHLLILFASVKENNLLSLFEHRLLEMSASIYFEQKILKAFADVLYMLTG